MTQTQSNILAHQGMTSLIRQRQLLAQRQAEVQAQIDLSKPSPDSYGQGTQASRSDFFFDGKPATTITSTASAFPKAKQGDRVSPEGLSLIDNKPQAAGQYPERADFLHSETVKYTGPRSEAQSLPLPQALMEQQPSF